MTGKRSRRKKDSLNFRDSNPSIDEEGISYITITAERNLPPSNDKSKGVPSPNVGAEQSQKVDPQINSVKDSTKSNMNTPTNSANTSQSYSADSSDGTVIEKKQPVKEGEVDPNNDKTKKTPVVQEIKYYEGSFNFFGGPEETDPQKKEIPFPIKITKTVTFEKGRENECSQKCLGIDSWMQTDKADKCDETQETNCQTDEEPACGSSTVDSEKFFECAKICYECLRTLAKKCQSEALTSNEAYGKPMDSRCCKTEDQLKLKPSCPKSFDCSTLTSQSNIDCLKRIVRLIMEAIPNEIYNRIMCASEPSSTKNQEFEVRLKGCGRERMEICNENKRVLTSDSKHCKEFPSQKAVLRNEKMRSEGCPCCPCMTDQQEMRNEKEIKSILSFQTKRDEEDPRQSEEERTKDDDKIYDFQITLDGRKIHVTFDRCAEKLFLPSPSQTILKQNVNEIKPKSIATSQSIGKSTKQTNTNLGYSCNNAACQCYRGPKIQSSVSTIVSHNCRNKQESNMSGFESWSHERKEGNYSISQKHGISPKPVVTSPPYGDLQRKSSRETKQLNMEKDKRFDTSRNLYWCNVEVAKKLTENRKEENSNIPSKARNCDTNITSLECLNTAESYKVSQTAGLSRLEGNITVENSCNAASSLRPSDRVESKKSGLDYRHRSYTDRKMPRDCLPLYWETQFMKYCDRIIPKDSNKTDKYDDYKRGIRGASNACVINTHEIGQRVVVTPTGFAECNAIDNTPLCVFKMSDTRNCKRTNDDERYRDFTVVSLTSIKLNSNPFHSDPITCRKCIETLQACTQSLNKKWATEKSFLDDSISMSDSNPQMNVCQYYWKNMEVPNGKVGELEDSKMSKCINESTAKSMGDFNVTERPITFDDSVPMSSDSCLNLRATPHYDNGLTGYNRSVTNCCCSEESSATFGKTSAAVNQFQYNEHFPNIQSDDVPKEKYMNVGTQYIRSDTLQKKIPSDICFKVRKTDSQLEEENMNFVMSHNKIFCKHLSAIEGNDRDGVIAEKSIAKGLEIYIDKDMNCNAIPESIQIPKNNEGKSNLVSDSNKSVFYCRLLPSNKLKSEKMSSRETAFDVISNKSECALNLYSTTSCIIQNENKRSLETIRSADKILLKKDSLSLVDTLERDISDSGNINASHDRWKFGFKKSWRWWKRKKV